MPDHQNESIQSVQVDPIPPEEEELFREFQAYVRSIYTAATSGAIQMFEAKMAAIEDQLRRAGAELQAQVDFIQGSLTGTHTEPAQEMRAFLAFVEQSREAYADQLSMATTRLHTTVESAVRTLTAKRQEDLASLRAEIRNSYTDLLEQTTRINVSEGQRRLDSATASILAAISSAAEQQGLAAAMHAHAIREAASEDMQRVEGAISSMLSAITATHDQQAAALVQLEKTLGKDVSEGQRKLDSATASILAAIVETAEKQAAALDRLEDAIARTSADQRKWIEAGVTSVYSIVGNLRDEQIAANMEMESNILKTSKAYQGLLELNEERLKSHINKVMYVFVFGFILLLGGLITALLR